MPLHERIRLVVVGAGFDAADDWIAETADARSVVVTADILLADRCLKTGAIVIAPNGKPFTAGELLAEAERLLERQSVGAADEVTIESLVSISSTPSRFT